MNAKIPKINLFLFCLIISCILHTFFYKVFIQNSQTIQTSQSPHFVSIQFSNPKAHLSEKKNIRSENQPNAEKTNKLLKNRVYKPPSYKTNALENEPENKPPIGNPVLKAQILNFIRGISLPKKVMNQNLFPRKYAAEFEFQVTSRHVTNITLKNFSPMDLKMDYLDKIVQNAFSKKLQQVSHQDLAIILLQFDQEQNPNFYSNDVHNVTLIIDFMEKN